MPQLNTNSVNSQADNIGTDYATATLTIYSGAAPATADDALSGNTALVEHTLAGWGAAAIGVITAAAIADATILADGTATFARLVQGSNTMQVTVGTSGAELILSTLTYVTGGNSVVNSLTITQPKN